jgi:hypothetical protein
MKRRTLKMRKIKKFIGAIMLVTLASTQLIACSPKTCKEKDCDSEVYEDTGYCKYHYMANEVKEGINGIKGTIKRKVNGES